MHDANDGIQTATLGGGCFWCLEAVFNQLEGVVEVVSGYAGGARANPSYQQVCSGATGHAEVIQVSFDPDVIPYRDLLTVFFHLHDPTQLNRQGHDIGTQYRSVIFWHDRSQRDVAEELVAEFNASATFDGPIVTERSELPAFYPAEAYHQGYFDNNPGQPYCQAVVMPKVAKTRKDFQKMIKKTIS